MIIKTEDPGLKGVQKAIKQYTREYPDYADALRLYGQVMRAQQRTLRELKSELEMEQGEIDLKLAEGVPLLNPLELDIDLLKYRRLTGEICAVIAEHGPEGFAHCDEIASWEGLDEGDFARTRNDLLTGKRLSLGEKWSTDEEREIGRIILWEALAPFYRRCASILESKMEQAFWLRGFCPICGGAPLMGVFRSEDGLWLLECTLCHTLWNVQRARCPFCDESEGSLKYLFIGDNETRRVQYCEHCGIYVKTVDMRDTGREASLPLENIITADLDMAAAQEGLKPAGPGGAIRG
jgi:FdhE protein